MDWALLGRVTMVQLKARRALVVVEGAVQGVQAQLAH
jgi:hypothetical protein